MKRLTLVVFGLLLAAGCSSSSSTPSSTPTTSGTTTTRFTATLSPAQETPTQVTGPEAAGSGVATVDFNITRDASGAISAATCNFTVTMQSFPATTVVNIAHIHTGATGVAGPVLVHNKHAPRPGGPHPRGGVVHARRHHHAGGDGAVDSRQPGRVLLQRAHRGLPRGRDARAAGKTIEDNGGTETSPPRRNGGHRDEIQRDNLSLRVPPFLR